MSKTGINKKIAIVFPGQGSQAVGMLSELAESNPQVIETFEQASSILGLDLWSLSQEGPKDRLDDTRYTQPALLCAGVAVLRCLRQAGLPDVSVVAGHSLGEYTALVAAKALGFDDAVRVVARRGEFMQAAVPAGVGAMAAILGLDDSAVRQVCTEAADDQVVAAVNFNSPGQVVIAGHAEAVKRAAELAKQAGAKRALMLDVSVPSHCVLMEPAAEWLAEVLSHTELHLPEVAVVHNVTVAEADSVASIRRLLVDQLSQPVRWVETMRSIKGRGVNVVLEAGPGKVLTGLSKRIDKSLQTLPVFDPTSLEMAMEALNA